MSSCRYGNLISFTYVSNMFNIYGIYSIYFHSESLINVQNTWASFISIKGVRNYSVYSYLCFLCEILFFSVQNVLEISLFILIFVFDLFIYIYPHLQQPQGIKKQTLLKPAYATHTHTTLSQLAVLVPWLASGFWVLGLGLGLWLSLLFSLGQAALSCQLAEWRWLVLAARATPK